jgi:dihydrofolate synthase/folylpolyglutamate synthase
LREIAEEKAGIIKPGVPVISAVEKGEAFEVIQRRAQEESAKLTWINRDTEVIDLGLRGSKQVARIDGHEFALGLVGPHQISNAACAVEAMCQLRRHDPQSSGHGPGSNFIGENAIARGLESTLWPGRFEIISEKPLILLDGAHNPAGVKMLVETWRAFLTARYGWNAEESAKRTRLVFASVIDKDISEMVQMLRPLVHEVLLVRLANERGAEPTVLAQSFAGLPCTCYNSVSDMWSDLTNSPLEMVTMVTGSLFLVGEMLARRQDTAEEYNLNERLEKFSVIR